MKITFRNKRIEELANTYKLLSQSYGKQAPRIIKRLDQLRACPTFKHMTFDRPHELKGNKKGIFAVDIEHPFRILFKPLGEFDSSNRTTIIDIEIQELCEDYH